MTVLHWLVDWINSIEWGHDNVLAAATVILAFGTIFLWLSTRALVSEGKRSSERQLRAYVLFDGGSISPMVTDAGRHFLNVQLLTKNYGQTPAYRFSYWHSAAILDPGDTPEYKKGTTDGGAATVIGPNGEMSGFIRVPLNGIDGDVIKRREKIVHAWGRYDYVDAFDKPRYFEFFLTQGNWEPPGLWSLIPAKKASEGN